MFEILTWNFKPRCRHRAWQDYKLRYEVPNTDEHFDSSLQASHQIDKVPRTIKENNLPIKIAIMNNSSQMMVTIWEKLFYNERYTATSNKHNPNYPALANSFGIDSMYCDNKTNLSESINKFINHPSSILCEFKIIPDICLPLVGPGKALDDMILFKDYNNDIKISGIAPS